MQLQIAREHCFGNVWVGEQPLLLAASKSVPYHMQGELIAEYWDEQRGWKWDKISEYLHGEILKQIASYELFPEDDGDELYWKDDRAGKCKTKSVIRLIRNEPTLERGASWKWI